MRLERLRILQLPGIRPGFGLEGLDPGINLIVGPNASGKSSLVRAFRHLVGGRDRDDPPTLYLEAELQSRRGSWLVMRTGSQISWRRDGSPADAPLLPDPRFFHCYWLRVEDLLHSEHEGDQEIVARLRRELTGGYDVDGLLGRDGPFQVGARHGAREAREFREARDGLREVARAYESLQRDRERLPELSRKIEDGARIRVAMDRTDLALELLEARRKRMEAEAAMEELPAASEEMARLRGDEGERLDRLGERRRGLEEERQEWLRKRRDAEAALRGTGLVEGAPGKEDLDLESRILRKARELLRDRKAAVEREEEALVGAGLAAGRLGAAQGARPALDPEAVSKAESLAVALEEVRKSIQELEGRVEGAPDPPEADDLEARREAVWALRAWLGAAATHLGKLLWPAVGVLVGSLVAVTASRADQAAVALGAAALAALSAVGVGVLAWTARQERVSARNRFHRVGLEPPRGWTVPEVTTRLDEMEKGLVELREADARARRAQGDRERLEAAREELRELESRKGELAGQVGFDPELTARSLHEFVRLVDEFQNARADGERAAAEVRRLDAEIFHCAQSVGSFLDEWEGGGGPYAEARPPEEFRPPQPSETASDAPEAVLNALETSPPPAEIAVDALEAGLESLAGRCHVAKEARDTIGRARETVSRSDQELKRLDEEEAEIFDGAGLAMGARSALDLRLGVLEPFRKRDEELREERSAESRLRTRLGDDEELLARVEADDEEGLRRVLEGLGEEAEEVEDWKRKRTALETRLQDAGADGKLEEAMARVEEARAALEDAHDEALLAAAGQLLLEEVKEEHRTEHEPAVFRDARERFQRFTHNQWTLELDDDVGFTARDLTMGEKRSLGELSSGTRMQLLLAVRVAWTRTLEEGREPLPFFLDEALTTSDPARFASVAESLASLAREEDRQIFYLCAQPADVQLWERGVGERPRVIDLAEARFGSPSEAGPDDFSLAGGEEIPEPAGESPEGYAARLGVPPIDPWENPGAVHLFHLLRDDLSLLHNLISAWGVAAQGPLEGLLKSSAAEHAVPDPDSRMRLMARCRVSRLWVRAWQTGRGRPVGRGALEESGAISETFMDRANGLANELGGDPRALLRALRDLPRFRAGKVEELEVWLEEHGYLLPGDPLGPREREARVLLEARGLLEPGQVREVVSWLEAGVGKGPHRPG